MKFSHLVLTGAFFSMSFAAHAASNDRVSLVEGEKETLVTPNLAQGQCSLSVTDAKAGIHTQIALSPVVVRSDRDFLGEFHFSSWIYQVPGTFASVQVFRSDEGNQAISISLDLTYRGLEGSRYSSAKNNQFVLLLDSSNALTAFKEQLSYEIHDEKTNTWVRYFGALEWQSLAIKSDKTGELTDSLRVGTKSIPSMESHSRA